MMILVCLFIIYGIYYVISNNGGSSINLNKGNNAEETLRERYVNGEIDEVMYERMMKIIKN